MVEKATKRTQQTVGNLKGIKMARPEIKTIQNLESAFAGESMAHIKYRYFAKLARAAGDEETAKIFEATADQEVMHAFGHLDLLTKFKTIVAPTKVVPPLLYFSINLSGIYTGKKTLHVVAVASNGDLKIWEDFY